MGGKLGNGSDLFHLQGLSIIEKRQKIRPLSHGELPTENRVILKVCSRPQPSGHLFRQCHLADVFGSRKNVGLMKLPLQKILRKLLFEPGMADDLVKHGGDWYKEGDQRIPIIIIKMKVLIAQGGGPTAVINESLVGAVLEAKKNGLEIWGSKNGISGIMKEDLINLTEIDDQKLERIAKTPASALGSTRDKPDAEYCAKILEVFKKNDIRGFFYIGGNDSSETIRLVLEAAKNSNYEMKGFHIPKTVDNDLMENDHTPGFPSAARFVAKAVMGIERDNAALPGIHLCIIMGRHAGFLTAAGGYGGAHLTYIPEVPFDLNHFADDVKKTLDQHGRAVIAISEGVQDKDGQPIITRFVKSNEVDAHGNVQLSSLPLGDVLSHYLKEKLKISRVRSDTFGYTQRSFPDPSPVDSAEARDVGIRAIQEFLKKDRASGSITVLKNSIEVTDLDKVANKTRHMPAEYYDPESKTITQACRDYLKPLVGELPSFETLF